MKAGFKLVRRMQPEGHRFFAEIPEVQHSRVTRSQASAFRSAIPIAVASTSKKSLLKTTETSFVHEVVGLFMDPVFKLNEEQTSTSGQFGEAVYRLDISKLKLVVNNVKQDL